MAKQSQDEGSGGAATKQTKLDSHLSDNIGSDTQSPAVGEKRSPPSEGEDGAADGNEPSRKATKKKPGETATATAIDGPLDEDERKLKGGDVDKDEDVRWKTLEQGLVYFFYRPKVQAAEGDDSTTKSLDDIQKTHIILVPRDSTSETAVADETEGTDKIVWRQISIGKKRLPDPEAALKQGVEPGGIGGRESEAIWATISAVGKGLEELADGLKENRYSTKTRGDRLTPAVRPAGRGHYLLSLKETDPPSSREVRLSYHLSHPTEAEFGNVQEELGLHTSSSVLLQLRNPTLPQTGAGAPPAGLPAQDRADFTKAQLDRTFGGDADKGSGNRYARPEELELLDQSGIELLLIKRRAADEVAAGDQQKEALESLASRDAEHLDDEQVLEELKLKNEQFPVDALKGDWV